MANPGIASCWVWLSRGRGRGKSHRGPQEGEKHQDEQVQVLPPLSGPSVLEAPPGFWWGELIHIPHLIVGLVAHSEDELVAEANLLLGHKWQKHSSQSRKGKLAPPRALPCQSWALTFWGLARSRTWVMAEGWTMGLNAGSSVPEGGCSLTFMT